MVLTILGTEIIWQKGTGILTHVAVDAAEGAAKVVAKDAVKVAAETKADAQGGTAARGIATHRSVTDLLVEANTPFNDTGISQAARSWDKHAARAGGTFKPLSGTIAEKNAAVNNWIKEVLTNPRTTMKQLRRGGVEYRLPNGQGVAFDPGGKVNVLDPSWG